MDKCCIVLNPEARASRRFGVAYKIANAAPFAEVRITEGPGHAELLAREAVAHGFDTIVAGGGDGTVNEVLRGITGSNVRLGVLPLGTMNVFARELNLPLEWTAAWKLIASGQSRRVDLGWANHMPIAQLAGVGFDAAAIARVHPGLKRRLGPVAYVWAGVQQLFAPIPQLTITAEGQAPIHGVWVVLGTGRYYGCPFPVFPNARNGDGLWNVLVVRNLSPQCLLKGLLTLPLGRHLDLGEISHFRTRRVRVELSGGEQGNPALEVDGEVRGFAPVDFWIEQNALRVAAP